MAYDDLQATAARLIASKGFAATFRAAGTIADPVTGLGAADGDTRTVNAVKVAIDRRTFAETLTERAACMLLCDGLVSLSDVWVDGGADRPVIGTNMVEPDNSTLILCKVLIGA